VGSVPPPTAAPRRLVASIERGPCYGRCPVYTVRVFADGAVEFEGRQHVGTVGVATGKLSAAELVQLAAAFESRRFESLKAEYADPRTTDLPWVTVSNGRKTVRHYTGDESAPKALTELEAAIDRLVGTARWLAGPEQ
jgi:hypothetical protein